MTTLVFRGREFRCPVESVAAAYYFVVAAALWLVLGVSVLAGTSVDVEIEEWPEAVVVVLVWLLPFAAGLYLVFSKRLYRIAPEASPRGHGFARCRGRGRLLPVRPGVGRRGGGQDRTRDPFAPRLAPRR